MPQLRYLRTQQQFVVGQLPGRERVLAAVEELGAGCNVIALHQQGGNGALGIQNALALHFGRVRGQHGRYQAV
ncbi:hypothetical protein D3C71_2189090 [compost metagenome]